MSLPETITVPRWTYLLLTIGLAISTIAHLFHLAVDFIR